MKPGLMSVRSPWGVWMLLLWSGGGDGGGGWEWRETEEGIKHAESARFARFATRQDFGGEGRRRVGREPWHVLSFSLSSSFIHSFIHPSIPCPSSLIPFILSFLHGQLRLL